MPLLCSFFSLYQEIRFGAGTLCFGQNDAITLSYEWCCDKRQSPRSHPRRRDTEAFQHRSGEDVSGLQALLELAPEFKAKIEVWLSELEIKEPFWDDYMEFDWDFYLGLATIL